MSVIVLKYQDNFADNLSELAYGRLLEKSTDRKCFFENDIAKRKNFEKKFFGFNIEVDYLSKNQVESITNKSYFSSRKFIREEKIAKELYKHSGSDKILDIKFFRIDDIKHINNSIINEFSFKNIDFMINYDILEEIKSQNSIGLYINSQDTETIDLDFINRASSRLNKYIKKPVLYIFSNQQIPNLDDLAIKHKFIKIPDLREEFYLLTQCKSKIIIPDTNSYSENFWATVLNKNTYLTAFDKRMKVKKIPENWISV